MNHEVRYLFPDGQFKTVIEAELPSVGSNRFESMVARITDMGSYWIAELVSPAHALASMRGDSYVIEGLTDTQAAIHDVCAEIRDLLLEKNAAYGDSAINPLRVFSKADPVEQINVRIDDKLSRIARGSAAGEDAEWDLLGYLILKRVAQKLQPKEEQEEIE